jgi:hypothetical protein
MTRTIKMPPKHERTSINQGSNLVSSRTTLHVLLEGFTLWDGLSWVIGDNRGWVTGVCLTSHGPSHLLGDGSVGRLWVRVNSSVNGGDEGWLGSRGEGRSRCNEGKDDDRLGLMNGRGVSECKVERAKKSSKQQDTKIQ